MEKFVFYILAIIMIVAAIASVSSRKMLRSVVYLLFVLIGIAGIYFLIDYNFLAAVQLTVYAGGIIVLVIFSVLLVHHIEMELEMAKLPAKILTGLLCLVGLGIFLITIYSYDFKVVENYKSTSVADIGRGLLSYDAGGFILPFEVISVLLLAAMIGAIIIGKGDKLTKNDEIV
ncbi:NADH-quinone oxidoreductase subunit J family protein [Flavobacterium cellulosilyticum]|uniref:NADH-quinone oxidoreductase subunit J n=1 Tax=Flavobacterium cellulosilyticum TaxID=2541731 RepID=A0A4R5CHD5_9FLAO|nr:NADH-quinone oxidoreductase subunit J [Flavobacterium cellulosilyticum]TDD98456.1 NADH-quinone oxidoreductase subunit J [Flavobacterium cellulosilyticum]